MRETSQIVQVSLNGGRVTLGFRQALFDAAARAGVSANEFVLTATGEKLRQLGRDFPGVFPETQDERVAARRSTASDMKASG